MATDDQTPYPVDGNNIVQDDTITPEIAAARQKLADMVGPGAKQQASGGRHVPTSNQRTMAERHERERRDHLVSVLERARDRARELAQQRQEDGQSRSVPPEKSMAAIDAQVASGRQRQITAQLIGGNLDDTERAALTAELKALVAAHETGAEKKSREDQSLEDQRVVYDVKDPTLPAPWLQSYNEDWAPAYEPMLYEVARETGLAGEHVRGLRDTAIVLGQEIAERGTPASEKELAAHFDRLKIPASARPALVKLYRRLEGGDAA